MMPHCKRDSQYELFESDPRAEAGASTKIALPFQRSAEIDLRRARLILGVSGQTMVRLIRAGSIRGHLYLGAYRIEYQSLLSYCDELCLKYMIARPRPAKSPLGRIRDRDMLPFPLDETVYMKDVTARLDCSIQAAIHLIEKGALVAYKVGVDGAGAPWRVHDKSLDRHIATLHASVPSKPNLAP